MFRVRASGEVVGVGVVTTKLLELRGHIFPYLKKR